MITRWECVPAHIILDGATAWSYVEDMLEFYYGDAFDEVVHVPLAEGTVAVRRFQRASSVHSTPIERSWADVNDATRVRPSQPPTRFGHFGEPRSPDELPQALRAAQHAPMSALEAAAPTNDDDDDASTATAELVPGAHGHAGAHAAGAPGADHAHEHSHGRDGATHAHEHSHALETEAAHHDHAHLHAYVDEATIPAREPVPPCERVIGVFEAADVAAGDVEIRYCGTSGLKVTVLDGIGAHKRLEALVLRSNLVSDCTPIKAHGHTLVHLELYDNRVRSLRGVEACPNLEVLDMSYNGIRDMRPVAVCTKLRELYLAANKLRTIEGTAKLERVAMVDLGANRIRVMEQLPPNARKVFLGKNKIEKIENLEGLRELRVLDVQSNRLTSLDGAFPEGCCGKLEELYLAHNAIPNPAPGCFSALAALTTIDLGHNKISDFGAIAELAALEDLWLSYNAVPTCDAVAAIAHLPLTCVYLEHNPCAKEPKYANFLRDLFPRLEQLDANLAPPRGRPAA